MKRFLKNLKLIRESFLYAIHSVVVNKMRTFLSLFGITIGIFSIISVFTVIDSLEKNIRDSVESLGSDVIYIQKFPWQFSDDEYPWWKYVNRPNPKISEMKELEEMVPTIEAISFDISTYKTLKYGGNYIERIQTTGTTHDFDKLQALDIESGRYFTPNESTMGGRVAIVGATVAEELFVGEDPIGKRIKISGIDVTVIGFTRKEGQNMMGMSADRQCILPYLFARTIMNENWSNPNIRVKSIRYRDQDDFEAEVGSAMRIIRRIPPAGDDSFALNKISAMSGVLDAMFAGINLGGGIIGIFSIIVGAFGIANIMFVSVRERTTQIGVEKALGAKRWYILLQFMYEAMLLSLVGGALGLLLIFGGVLIINNSTDAFTLTMTIKNIIIGLGISAAVGALAGFFPAYSAAKMQPVKAIFKV